MRVRFDRDSHSGVPPACRDRPRVCPPLTRQDEICYAVGRPNWHGARTDTGSVPTCGLTPELASVVYYPLTPRRLKQILKPNSRSFSSRLWENVSQFVLNLPTSWKASRRLFRLVQPVGKRPADYFDSSNQLESVPQIVLNLPTSWKTSHRLFRLVQLVGKRPADYFDSSN